MPGTFSTWANMRSAGHLALGRALFLSPKFCQVHPPGRPGSCTRTPLPLLPTPSGTHTISSRALRPQLPPGCPRSSQDRQTSPQAPCQKEGRARQGPWLNRRVANTSTLLTEQPGISIQSRCLYLFHQSRDLLIYPAARLQTCSWERKARSSVNSHHRPTHHTSVFFSSQPFFPFFLLRP